MENTTTKVMREEDTVKYIKGSTTLIWKEIQGLWLIVRMRSSSLWYHLCSLQELQRKSIAGCRFWLFIGCTVVPAAITGQTRADQDAVAPEWKMWTTVALDLEFSKKAELSLGHLRSYAMNSSMESDFNQYGASFSYDLARWNETRAGYILTQSAGSGKRTSRYFLRTMFRINLGDRIKWSNGVQVEKHSANEHRFDYRYIFITRLELRKRIDFLNLSPSVSYWVFYNAGGSAIQYYDRNGQPTFRSSPDGLHRARLWINLNSKISDAVSVSVYYLSQFEYNLIGQETRINIKNPVTGKFARPYNNYNVAGITLKLNLDL